MVKVSKRPFQEGGRQGGKEEDWSQACRNKSMSVSLSKRVKREEKVWGAGGHLKELPERKGDA